MKTLNKIIIFLLLISSLASNACPPRDKVIRDKDFKTEVVEYFSTNSKKLILIIPPTGGINFIDKSYARDFCKNKLNALITSHWTNDKNTRIAAFNFWLQNLKASIEIMIPKNRL